MSEVFLKWALGFNGIIILSLIGVIWRMLGTRLDRIEKGILKEIDRQEVEIKDLRVRKHDATEALVNHGGQIATLEQDVSKIRSRLYGLEELVKYKRSNGA